MRLEGPRIVGVSSRELNRLKALYRKWIKGAPKIWVPPRRKLSSEEAKQYTGLQVETAEIDLDPLLGAIDSKLRSFSMEFANAGRSQPQGPRELNITVSKGISLAKSVDALVQLEVVRKGWPEIIRSVRAASTHRETVLFTAMAIASINYPVLITGEPGGGKTTLLRRLSQMIARTSSQLPLLIPLVRIPQPTARALIGECLFTLSNLGGYRMEEEEFVDALDHADFVSCLTAWMKQDGSGKVIFGNPEIFTKT